MNTYHRHSLALTDEENTQFKQVKKMKKYGIKKIFMVGLSLEVESIINSAKELKPVLETPIRESGEDSTKSFETVPIKEEEE